MPIDSTTEYWLRLNAVPGVGPVRFFSLKEHFGGVENVFSAGVSQLTRINGMDQKLASSIHSQLDYLDLEKEIALMEEHGVRVVTYEDDEYPAMLKEIPYPPPLLYVRGTIKADEVCISVVGTRRACGYGRHVAESVGRGLAQAGVTVVSGLARGIDGYAQRSALDAGGRTIGVMGCGMAMVYPSEHRKLADMVVNSGALISEFPMTTPPHAGNFPRRNRIIAGLSRGTVVVEAGEKSGALLSADHTLNQGKEVYAVPGPINMESFRGCHSLIRDGARLLQDVEDILKDLGFFADTGAVEEEWTPKDLTPEQERIFSALTAVKPVHMDDLIRESGLPTATVNVALIDLELAGYIRQMPGKLFYRSR